MLPVYRLKTISLRQIVQNLYYDRDCFVKIVGLLSSLCIGNNTEVR